MTEKRFNFNLNKYQIEYNGKYFAHLDVIDAQKIVNMLNEQHEVIEEIETTLDNMVTFKNKYRDKYKKIKKENEQLKQQLIDVDKLIDDKIKEYQKYDEYDTEKYYIGTQLLKELKKELKGDMWND